MPGQFPCRPVRRSGSLGPSSMQIFRLMVFILAVALSGCSKQGDAPNVEAPRNTTTSVEVKSSPASAPALNAKVALPSITLGVTNVSDGLTLVNEVGDGATSVSNIEGVPCRMIERVGGLPPVYMYFRIDPTRAVSRAGIIVAVDYFDDTSGSISIDYDSSDEFSKNPAYTRIPTRVDLKNDKRWHLAAFMLEKPRFERGMHDGGDFRIALSGSHLFVRAVQLVQE